jgi:hypothetical protein
LLVALAACTDDVPLGSNIERTRVLAVRAWPVADPTRAWPRPGEESRLSLVVASPAETPALAWRLELCAATCTTHEGVGVPEISFVAPDAERLLVTGTVSPEGEPATSLTFDVGIDRGTPNFHPRPAEVIVPDGCVEPEAEVTLRAITTAADRESFGDDRESLRLSFFTTAGELARQYAVVERDDPRDPAEAEDTWTAPREEGNVRYLVVVRDLRGGVEVSTGTLCVRRP